MTPITTITTPFIRGTPCAPNMACIGSRWVLANRAADTASTQTIARAMRNQLDSADILDDHGPADERLLLCRAVDAEPQKEREDDGEFLEQRSSRESDRAQ